jgi:hypothetical protein
MVPSPTRRPLFGAASVRHAVAVVAPAIAALMLTAVTAAQAARQPTARERGAIEQAIFDDYLDNHVPTAHAAIRKIRISTHVRVPRGKATAYRAFARVDLYDGTASGRGTTLLGYRRGSLPGWRVLDIGSVAVGCLPASVFGGHRSKSAVLRDLKLDCP